MLKRVIAYISFSNYTWRAKYITFQLLSYYYWLFWINSVKVQCCFISDWAQPEMQSLVQAGASHYQRARPSKVYFQKVQKKPHIHLFPFSRPFTKTVMDLVKKQKELERYYQTFFFIITRCPCPPCTSSENTSRKCLATPLKVRSIDSSLRWSKTDMSSLIFCRNSEKIIS